MCVLWIVVFWFKTHLRIYNQTQICRVGQNHLCMMHTRYFRQGSHQIYGHIRCTHTVLATTPVMSCSLPLVRYLFLQMHICFYFAKLTCKFTFFKLGLCRELPPRKRHSLQTKYPQLLCQTRMQICALQIRSVSRAATEEEAFPSDNASGTPAAKEAPAKFLVFAHHM